MTFAVRQAKWQSLLCCVSWSVFTRRQTESLSVQLRNLITTARGEPCVSTVHLSDIFELHPSLFCPFFFGFKSNDERKPRICRQLRAVCHPSVVALSWYCGDNGCLVFSVFFEQMMFTLSCFSKWSYCSSLRTYRNSASLQMPSIFMQSRWWQTSVFEEEIGSSSLSSADIWQAVSWMSAVLSRAGEIKWPNWYHV